METDAPESLGFTVTPGNNAYINLEPDTRAEASVQCACGRRQDRDAAGKRCSGVTILTAWLTALASIGCSTAPAKPDSFYSKDTSNRTQDTSS
jgi:hypothetical protein